MNLNNIGVSRHFEFLWERSIMPAIQCCMKEVDENFKNESGFKINDLEKYKEALCPFYKEKREWLKELYSFNAFQEDASNVTLDLHKIASVITRSIVGRKFFIFDTEKASHLVEGRKAELKKLRKALKKINSDEAKNEIDQKEKEYKKWCINNIFINYKLAFLAGVGITFLDTVDKCLEKDEKGNVIGILEEKKELFEGITKNQGLFFYAKSKTHGSFFDSSIIMLMKNDVNNRDFDYLAWATIFFQLQTFNKLLFAAKNDTINSNIDFDRLRKL